MTDLEQQWRTAQQIQLETQTEHLRVIRQMLTILAVLALLGLVGGVVLFASSQNKG